MFVIENKLSFVFFVYGHGYHRNLLVLTHSLPTRRSSDLRASRLIRASGRAAPRPAPTRWCAPAPCSTCPPIPSRSEEHTSELQSLMRISYAVFCLKKKKRHRTKNKKV